MAKTLAPLTMCPIVASAQSRERASARLGKKVRVLHSSRFLSAQYGKIKC